LKHKGAATAKKKSC